MSYGDKPLLPGQPIPVQQAQPVPVEEPPMLDKVTVRPDIWQPNPDKLRMLINICSSEALGAKVQGREGNNPD